MKLISSKVTNTQIDLGLLLLRVVAGASLLVNHGWAKVSNFEAVLGKWNHSFLGLPSHFQVYMIIFAEFICAGLIILGLLSRLACIPIIIGIGFAFFKVHSGQLFSGGESAAIFLTIFIALLIMGPGKYSIDKLLLKK